jgi:hypothetical protein
VTAFVAGQVLTAEALNAAFGATAPLVSPILSGTPTAPTASPGTNNTQLATTAFVHAAAGVPATFAFSQPVAASSWTITHGLATFPSVVVVDTAGNLIEGDVFYTSASVVTLTFSAPFAGQAYLI